MVKTIRLQASDIVALETASAARVAEKRSQIAEEELRLERALQVCLTQCVN